MTLMTPTVSALGQLGYRLNWTGTPGATVRVFLNGLLTFGPTVMDDFAKEVTVSFPDPCILEVHENGASEVVEAISIPLQRKPMLWWLPQQSAVEYVVYSAGQVLARIPHEPALDHYEYTTLRDLRQDGGFWTSLRVEAVNAKGAETVRTEFAFRAPGTPAAPTGFTAEVDGVTPPGGTLHMTVAT